MAVAILLFLFILFCRVKDGFVYRRKRLMNKKAQQMIMSFLFVAEEWEEARLEKFRKKHLKSKFLRQVYLDNLIQLHKNITGESSERLSSLYSTLGLKQHSLDKLRSYSWARAARGIGELAEMGSRHEIHLLLGFINHKNPILRYKAQVALLKLEGEAPFSFLDELKGPLSEWQQMQLALAAENTESSKLPDFTRWLSAGEASHVSFSVRMIAQFSCYQAEDELLSLLQHPFPSAAVRKEIVVAIRQLELFRAEKSLRELYPYEIPDIRLEIEKTLAVIAASEEEITHTPEKRLYLPVGAYAAKHEQEDESMSA